MTKTDNIRSMIDELGHVKAEIARLKVIEEAIKQQLIDAGPGAYEGDLFRATVSECSVEKLDMVAVRNKLTAQFIRAHTSVTNFFRVNVKARTGKT